MMKTAKRVKWFHWAGVLLLVLVAAASVLFVGYFLNGNFDFLSPFFARFMNSLIS